MIRVELAPGRDGETRPLADAEVRYENAVNSRKAVATASGGIRFSRDAQAVKDSVNIPVATEYTRNENALELARAVKLADEGQREEAAAVMRQSAARLRAAASTLAAPALAEDAERQEGRARAVTRGGLDNASRKSIVTDNYMIYNQQQQ